jgi:serine/threonine-protein kinase
MSQHAQVPDPSTHDLPAGDPTAPSLPCTDTPGASPGTIADHGPGMSAPPVLGGYELVHEAGRGGMGIVYQARHRASGRMVAMKVMKTAVPPDAADRFLREVRILGLLRHPHVASVGDADQVDGRLYYTMPFAPTTLGRQRQRFGDPRAAARLVAKVSRAVHVIHAHGIIHRDLKPGNILLTADGEPLVADFGLARWVDESRQLTETGAILGTAGYMAPEQAAGSTDRLTGAVDVWALGVVLYELVTGMRPFDADGTEAVLHQIRFSDPPPPRQFRPDLDAGLEAIILHCLRKQPSERYATAAALADDLDRWLAGRTVRARLAESAAKPAGRPRRLSTAAVAVLSLTGVAGLLAFALHGTNPPAPIPIPVQPGIGPVPSPEWVPYLTDQLTRGQPAELIDPTGYARYTRQFIGVAGDVKTGRAQFRGVSVFGVTADSPVGITLFPDPGLANYQLRAVVCQPSASMDLPEAWVGVSFGTVGWVADGRTMRCQCQWRFNDLPRSPFPPDAPPGADRTNLTTVVWQLPLQWLRERETEPYPRQGGLTADPRPADGPPWRTLTADVRPSGVRLQIDKHPAVTVPRAKLDEHYALQQQLAPPAPPQPLPFNPVGDIGVVVRRASLYVRSLTVIPLPPEE